MHYGFHRAAIRPRKSSLLAIIGRSSCTNRGKKGEEKFRIWEGSVGLCFARRRRRGFDKDGTAMNVAYCAIARQRQASSSSAQVLFFPSQGWRETERIPVEGGVPVR